MATKSITPLEMLKENITMSGVNTETEIELTLLEEIGKRSKKGNIKVMLIWGFQFEIVSGFDAAGVTDEDSLTIQFTTNTEGAEVEIFDKDCFFKKKWKRQFITGGHLNDKDVTPFVWFPQPLPYIKKRMWVLAESVGLAAAADINFTIYYTYGYLSQYQLNRMIATKI